MPRAARARGIRRLSAAHGAARNKRTPRPPRSGESRHGLADDRRTTVPASIVPEARAHVARRAARRRPGLARGRPGRRPPVRAHRRRARSTPARSLPDVAHRLRDVGRALAARATTRCSCCTRSRATATSSARPARPTRAPAGGRASSAPGSRIDTDRWFVVAPNVLGGCQGSTGPASLAPDGVEWGTRFPFLTIRDQVRAQLAFAAALGIERFAAVVGGSMGGDARARVGDHGARASSSASRCSPRPPPRPPTRSR